MQSDITRFSHVDDGVIIRIDNGIPVEVSTGWGDLTEKDDTNSIEKPSW